MSVFFLSKQADDFLEEIKVGNQDPLVLSDEVLEFIDNLNHNIEYSEIFLKHKLPIDNKILLYWEPGNWKTSLVSYIASLLELPLYRLKSSIIDSHLGLTSKNISSLFQAIKIEGKLILFIDEIDSYIRSRDTDDTSVSKEHTRIVNSFLQHLEELPSNIFIIWATNRIDALDVAAKRRFNFQIELKKPNKEQKKKYIKEFSKYHKVPQKIFSDIDLDKYISFFYLKNKLIKETKKYLIKNISYNKV